MSAIRNAKAPRPNIPSKAQVQTEMVYTRGAPYYTDTRDRDQNLIWPILGLDCLIIAMIT